MSEIISREDARGTGRIRFFTGVPCFRRHVAERYVKSGDCVMCEREDYRRATAKAKSARVTVPPPSPEPKRPRTGTPDGFIAAIDAKLMGRRA